MATKLISKYYCPYERAERKEFICDTDADFADLPEACTGSKAISLWSKKERVVNTKGRWVPYGENFVGSPILDLVKEEGSLEYGEEAQFKSVIGINDVTAYMNGNIIGEVMQVEQDGMIMKGYSIANALQSTASPSFRTATLIVQSPTGSSSAEDMIYFIMVMVSHTLVWAYKKNGGATFIEPDTNGLASLMENDNAWYEISFATMQATPLDEAPAIAIPADAVMNADLETTSVLFDAGGSATLLVTDTNDEGIVASYEVYADEALIDTVPKAEIIDATALGVTAGASVTVKAKSIIDTTSEASNAVVFE